MLLFLLNPCWGEWRSEPLSRICNIIGIDESMKRVACQTAADINSSNETDWSLIIAPDESKNSALFIIVAGYLSFQEFNLTA